MFCKFNLWIKLPCQLILQFNCKVDKPLFGLNLPLSRQAKKHQETLFVIWLNNKKVYMYYVSGQIPILNGSIGMSNLGMRVNVKAGP